MEHVDHGFPLTEVAFVIVVAVVLGLGLMRLKQPPLVGFILAGVVMGPTGFGHIATNESVTALAEMGVLMLLFFIGMELSIRAFMLSLRPALVVAGGNSRWRSPSASPCRGRPGRAGRRRSSSASSSAFRAPSSP